MQFLQDMGFRSLTMVAFLGGRLHPIQFTAEGNTLCPNPRPLRLGGKLDDLAGVVGEERGQVHIQGRKLPSGAGWGPKGVLGGDGSCMQFEHRSF